MSQPCPDCLIEARERARIVAWLMLFRARTRSNRNLSPEVAGQAEAIVGFFIEQIATGAHSDIDVTIGDDAMVLH